MKARHPMPFGADVLPTGVRFSIWAPAARYVNLHIRDAALPMEAIADGFFFRTVPEAHAGTRYAYSFDGTELRVPDPASRFNPEDVHAPSEVVDPERFAWRDVD
jgi:maltooligosyltrehalose trehalohydrolase